MSNNDKHPGISLQSFSKVVEAIYDCAIDTQCWQGAICLIAELCQSQWCALGVHDYVRQTDELSFRLGYDEEFWQLHEGKYKGMNPYFAPLQLLPVGTVATSAMLINDEEFHDTRFYRELVEPWGVHDTIGIKVLQTGHRIGSLAANRIKPYPRYGESEIQLFRLLSPHICHAVRISDALNLETVRADSLEATLDTLAAGVYLTDRAGRVVYMNSAAENQIKAGTSVSLKNRCLAPLDHTAREMFASAIAKALSETFELTESGFTIALPGRPTGLVATILPLTCGARRDLCGALAARAAIFVKDAVVVSPLPGEAFAKLYNLTGSELRVILAMVPGLGVKEAAALLGISETTAKTHLQHIYGKTRTSKQTELLRLFMNSAPPVTP